jgi:hypothetical protein
VNERGAGIERGDLEDTKVTLRVASGRRLEELVGKKMDKRLFR